MASSGSKSGQLCTPKANTAYTGLYAHSNGFARAFPFHLIFQRIRVFAT